MRFPWTTKEFLIPGLVVGIAVAAIIMLDQFYEVHYTFIGIGTVIVGTTGFGTLWQRAMEADRLAKRLEAQINGGMSAAAKQHVQEALDNQEIEVGLWRRVNALEDSKQECIEREKRCEEENERMRDWVVARLDQTPLGRRNDRTVGGDNAQDG